MAFLKSALSRLHHKPTPVVASNISLDFWCRQLLIQPTRLIRRVEICTALAAGLDAWGAPIQKIHHHTFLRVSFAPTSGHSGVAEDVILVERILSTGGAYHSITPITGAFSAGGTLFQPEVHDRICVVSEGPSTALARDLRVERTLEFGDGSSKPRLSLVEFSEILGFVSRMTMPTCAGDDCKFQSRSFAFTCMAALTPALPPPKFVWKGREAVGTNVEDGEDFVDDGVFELTAEAFLAQVWWLATDSVSIHALGLIETLKGAPQKPNHARLYH